MRRSLRRRGRDPTAAVAAICLLLAACGVQQDDSPRALSPDAVPFGLLDPTTTTPDEASRPDGALTTAAVYLVDNNGLLVEVLRRVPVPGSTRQTLRALLQGVTRAEAGAGLRSAITSGTDLLGLSGPVDGLVTVDLSGQLSDIAPEGQRLALAQVVFTATVTPDIDRVLFEIDGVQREVPNDQGVSTADPLTRDDFAELNPGPPPAPLPAPAAPVPPG